MSRADRFTKPGLRFRSVLGVGCVTLALGISCLVPALRAVVGVQKANATVVDIVRTAPTADRVHHCPVFQWTFEQRQVQHQSEYCGRDPRDFVRGSVVSVRFNPKEPSLVFPDTFMATYGQALLPLPFFLVALVIFLSMVRFYRRQQRLRTGED